MRKIICLRKSEVNVEKKVSNVIEKVVEHGIHYLSYSFTNDLRKNICLIKSEVYVNKKKGSNIMEKLVEHDINHLPCSYKNDVIDSIIIATMMPH